MTSSRTRKARIATVAAGAGAGLVLLRKQARRQRLKTMFSGIRDSLVPARGPLEPVPTHPGYDEAHAPGHGRLGPPPPDRSDTEWTREGRRAAVRGRWGALHRRG